MNQEACYSGRIAHLILQPRFSGAEILVRELASRQVSRWDKVGVIGLLPPEEEFLPTLEYLESKGVEVLVPDRHLNRVQSAFFYRRAVRKFKPSCVFAHSVLPGFYSRGSFLFQPCPSVTVLHDGGCQDYISPRLAAVERLLSHRLSGLIAVNPLSLDFYRDTIRDASSISHVIPNGITPELFAHSSERRESVRQELGLGPSSVLVLQVGRINRVKRQHLSLRALRPLAAQHGNIKVLFAGVFEEKDYLDQCVRESEGLDTKFLGSRSDIPDLMDAADLLLMPSAAEAHSVAFLEALASGKPIVGSNIPSFAPYGAMPGVSLVDPETNAYREAILSALERPGAPHPRDMSGYTIGETCDAYDSIALQLIGGLGKA